MHNKNQRGFTLLELMIALTVGLVLIGGTVAMMRNSGNSLKRHENNADMVSAIRLASNTLQHDIQSAGYFGRTRFAGDITGRLNDANPLPNLGGDCYSGFYADIQRYIFASDNTNPFATTCLSDVGYKANTDVLVVRYATDRDLTASTSTGSLNANKLYVYSNPTGGELFRGNSPPALNQYPYAGTFEEDIGKRFYELVTYVYFIGEMDDASGQSITGLYRLAPSDASGAPFVPELVSSDITDLQVQFGLDDCDPQALLGSSVCDGQIDEYKKGWDIAIGSDTPSYDDVSRIISTSVAFTSLSSRVQGADEMGTKTYTLRGQNIASSPAAMFQGNTFQVRNSEEIF